MAAAHVRDAGDLAAAFDMNGPEILAVCQRGGACDAFAALDVDCSECGAVPQWLHVAGGPDVGHVYACEVFASCQRRDALQLRQSFEVYDLQGSAGAEWCDVLHFLCPRQVQYLQCLRFEARRYKEKRRKLTKNRC